MTILEELVEIALKCCENSRQVGHKHHSRGASLLAQSGKVYTGCDVYLNSDSYPGANKNSDGQSIVAERAAIMTAVADGVNKIEVLPLVLNCMFRL
jgi:cytidine deaminase